MVLPTLDETTGIRVDFIFSFTPYESQAIRRAKKVQILGQDISFASAEDLIIHIPHGDQRKMRNRNDTPSGHPFHRNGCSISLLREP